MKRSIKLTLLIAVLTILLTTAFAMAQTVKTEGIVASGSCGDNVSWVLDSQGMLTISGSGK